MAEFLKLQFLGLIQGLTEFLPVSSSGHLSLLRCAFGIDETAGGPLLEILLHLGTLIAVIVFYRKRLIELTTGLLKRDKAAWQYSLAIVLSCIPAGLLYLFAHDAVERVFEYPAVVAALLLVTGVMLLTLRKAPTTLKEQKPCWWHALLIGAAQAVALLPGISRSGSTYCAARWLKIDSKSAFDFSFLMSLPVVGGAVLLKARHFDELTKCGNPFSLLCAAIVAGVVGYFALKFLSIIRIAGKFWLFCYWCFAVGIISLGVVCFR